VPAAGRAPIVERILAVTGEEVQRIGADHVRMSEVAEQAGISRASLYRYFANKEELIQGCTMRELDLILAGVDEAIKPYDNAVDRMGAAFVYAIPLMREHPVFVAMLNSPDQQLLNATLLSGEVLDYVRDLIAERLNRAVRAGRVSIDQFGATVASELLARILLSMIATPKSILRLDTGEDAHEFATQYLLPMLAGLAMRHSSAHGGSDMNHAG
jgi:Transcriptional regulator